MQQTITHVPLLDLQAQYEPIKDQILAKMSEVFDSKRFILGPEVDALEAESATYCETPHAIGVSSGTDAILMSLMALNIGHGDEVITTPFTFFATAGCIARSGATPIFVDIDPDTLNINPELIKEKITSKTKAIMPVHLFGQIADMDPILEIAEKHNLFVIEDACQSIGSTYTSKKTGKTHKAGSMGTVGCFSFFPSKNLGCAGDGGLVTTQDETLAKKLKSMRNHGEVTRYHHQFVGGNFRIDALQAAIIRIKLPLLEAQHEGRRKNAAYYNEHLPETVKTPVILDACSSIYNQYTIRSSNRDALMSKLQSHNIGCAIYYPLPLHLQECFKDLGYKKGDFPETEKAANEVLSLPVFAELSEEQLKSVVQGVLS